MRMVGFNCYVCSDRLGRSIVAGPSQLISMLDFGSVLCLRFYSMSGRLSIGCFLFMSFFSRLFGTESNQQRKIKIEAHETQAPSAEQIRRMEHSVDFLVKKNVPVNKTLPFIEDVKTSQLRSPKEIVERLIGCTTSAVAAETADRKIVDQIIADFNAYGFLTLKEKAFVDGPLTDRQQRAQFSWRYERSWVLLWALGYVEDLSYPDSICDVPKLAGTLRGKTFKALMAGAKPRSHQEVLDAADLIYRLDWAVVDARLNKKPTPAGLDAGVVLERHAALNWLTGYLDQDWDDITTDT